MAYRALTSPDIGIAARIPDHEIRVWTPVPHAPPRLAACRLRSRFSDALKDPAAAAARGKWLARGAWLLAAAEVVVAVRNHVCDRLTDEGAQAHGRDRPLLQGPPSNLSDRERKELRALLGKVEPGELAKKVATSPFAGRMQAPQIDGGRPGRTRDGRRLPCLPA